MPFDVKVFNGAANVGMVNYKHKTIGSIKFDTNNCCSVEFDCLSLNANSIIFCE